MTLKERITEDMKTAMRAKDSERLSAIRLLQAAIKQREVDERIQLDDAQVLAVIEKMNKQRRDSIEQYTAAGRQDLADRERFELELLQSYMPQPLSESEVADLIEAAIADVKPTGPKDMGKVMAWLKPRIAGRADTGRVSGIVKGKLG